MSKPASGVFIQQVSDADGVGLPQWQRVYAAVRKAIAGGALRRGQRLPSARQLARDWRVSRGAVDEAFAQLQLEGLIERRVGDGSYVAQLQPAASGAAAAPREPARLARLVLDQVGRSAPHAPGTCRAPATPPSGKSAPRVECAFTMRRAPPLHPRGVDVDEFDLATWRRLLVASASERRTDLLHEAPGAGLQALREAIARHLLMQRGLACDSEQILVLASPAEGLNLIVRLLLPSGGSVWLEQPTHPSLPWLLESLGARVAGVPLDEQGFDVAAALTAEPDATLVYLHALAQYPLGRRTGAARAQALLEWARGGARWVIEANCNDELWPPEQQPAALTRRDPERVLLLGTFEGIMFPSLRLAYLVVPRALVAGFTDALTLWGPRATAGVQWAMAEFIDRGHLQERLARYRARLASRRRTVQQLLIERLPLGVQAEPIGNGTSACLHLPRAIGDEALVRRLRERGIFCEPLSSMDFTRDGLNGLVFGYADGSDADLAAGLRRLALELQQACAVPPDVAVAAAG
jgi:GntR family transcriptional regulator/MocR family aminotransferase